MTYYKLVPVEPTPEMVLAGARHLRIMSLPDREAAAVFRAMLAAAPAVQGEPLRYTNDGALAECPCCGSIDVGGAHDTVSCYSCDLTVTKPRPLQNAIDAWNTRTGRTHPAPAVQGEPVATIHVDGSFVHVAWRIPAPSRCAMDVYTAPQPAEQQPELAKYQPCGCVICTCEHETQCQGCGGHHCGTHPVGQFPAPAYMQSAERQAPADYSLTPVPDELFAAEFNAWWEQHGQFCRAGGGDYECTFAFEAWRYLYPRLVKLQTAAAEQQPAPDVAGLVEALESLIKGYVSLLEAGMDRITSLGGDCDPVPVMEQNDPWLRDARAALAAHRKGDQP